MLTFICSTYDQFEGPLQVLISSLVCQTDVRWKCDIYHDGPPKYESINLPLKQSNQFSFDWSETRENVWGHNTRELGLDKVKTKYLTWTNGDNYYCPKYVELMLEAAEESDADLVLCDLVHSHYNYTLLKDVAPVVNHIDFCNFIIKTELAQIIGFPFRSFAADAEFIQAVMQTSPKWVKIDNILVVHN